MTEIALGKSGISISYNDRITILGSCFADSVGLRMQNAGFKCKVNPFGTLYNPLSIIDGLDRLESGEEFSSADCIEMGAGAGMICSFHHHTRFARLTEEEFLQNANNELKDASAFWKKSNKVIISLGTVYCYYREGKVVSNCLKRPSSEFERKPLSISETESIIKSIPERWPDKDFIFTVSPIRHLSDGAHLNQLSKSTLLLSVRSVEEMKNVEYFPAYEIVLDELRDYRFYAEDMTHPTSQAADYIWEKFVSFAVPSSEHERIHKEEKLARAAMHKANLYSK